MTELEYVLNRFDGQFRRMAGCRILLSGSGPYTQAILDRWDRDYSFAGLFLPGHAKRELFGKPVFGPEDLAGALPDAVILTEHKQKDEADYHAAAGFCEANHVALYDMYGVDETALHRELEEHRFQTLSGWKNVTAPYDVISFAVLDTYTDTGLMDGKIQVRPVFRRLTAWLREQGKQVLLIGRPARSREEQTAALLAGQAAEDAAGLDRIFYMRSGEDLCFRSIRERFPGKKILHIGAGLVNDGIIPRFYDIDTYRMVWFATRDLLPDRQFIKEEEGVPAAADREALEREIRRAEVVSFDLFDTLLMRCTLSPEDVFGITALRAARSGPVPAAFAAVRKACQESLPDAPLARIYEQIALELDLSDEEASRLMRLELETERAVLRLRQPVADLLRRAAEDGKRIFLVSDMCLPSAWLADLLNELGVGGYERLLVSCEEGLGKREGLLEELLKTGAAPEKILHIGDDLLSDIRPAESAGMRAFRIPSAAALAETSVWGPLLREAEDPAERGLLGMVLAEAFSDPFRFRRIREIPAEERLTAFARRCAAPVILGYLTGLAVCLREQPADGILFAARDGYLPEKLYRLLSQYENGELPPGRYFYCSRRAAFLPSAAEPETLGQLLRMAMELSGPELLKNACGLPEDRLLPWGPAALEPTGRQEEKRAYLEKHLPQLREVSEKALRGWKHYLEHCGLERGGRYVFMDFVAAGTTQQLLQRFVPFELSGYYFAAPEYSEDQPEEIRYCYDGGDSFFRRQFIEMESLMTSPEPSLDGFSEEGEPVFAEEIRSPETLSRVKKAQDELIAFAETWLELFYDGIRIRPEFAAALYAAEGVHEIEHTAFDDWLKKEWKAEET